MPKIFLSHSSEDKPWVRKLYDKLRSIDGIDPWLDEVNIRVGDSIILKIAEGVERADYVAIILSQNSINSKWVEKELSWAMSSELEKAGVVVLPILLDNIKPPFSIRDKKYLDFTDGFKYRQNLKELVETIQGQSSTIFVDDTGFNQFSFRLLPLPRDEMADLQKVGQVFFQSEDLIPKERMEAWHAKDPNSFRVLKNENGEISAFFMVFFIRKGVFDKFIEGKIREYPGFEVSSLLSPSEEQQEGEDYIYIATVVGNRSKANPVNIYILLYLARYLDLLRQHRSINKVYALASTGQGEKLIKRMEFSLQTLAGERQDGENLYMSDTSRIDSILEYLTLKCKLDFFKNYAEQINFEDEEIWRPVFDR